MNHKDRAERHFHTHESQERRLYWCPVCHGPVLSKDLATPPGAVPEFPAGQKLYCAHCEMLVEPEIKHEAKLDEGDPAGRDAATENRGRDRPSGSNAGGSQRGDLSDEGATQWRADPRENLRNTWKDKPLRRSRAAKR